MIKLLRADRVRLWKSKSFWICMLLSAALSVVNCIDAAKGSGWEYRAAHLFLTNSTVPLLLSPIYASLFLGTDYSDKTIRNKLIIGSSRTYLYFSNLVTIVTGSLLITAAAWLPCTVMACLCKELGMSESVFVLQIIVTILGITALSSIFTLLGMLITSRSANIAITVTATFMLCMTASVIMARLSQPEFIRKYGISEDGGIVQTAPEPNPAFVKEGIMRNILAAVNDILPTGQIIQIGNEAPHKAELMPLYSLGVISVTTAAGVLIFRRKDLK